MSPTRQRILTSRLSEEDEADLLARAKAQAPIAGPESWAAYYVRLAATLDVERRRHRGLLRALRSRGQWFYEKAAPFVVCRVPRAFFDAIPDLDAGDGIAPVSRGTIQ